VYEQANGDEDGVNKYAEAIEIASFAETARLLRTASAFASSETSMLQRSISLDPTLNETRRVVKAALSTRATRSSNSCEPSLWARAYCSADKVIICSTYLLRLLYLLNTSVALELVLGMLK
jgi:hypothetical protein